VRWLLVPVPFIWPVAREQRQSGSNWRWLGGASRHDSFSFDFALRGRGNEGVESEEGMDAAGRRSGGRWHAAREALRRQMELVAAVACRPEVQDDSGWARPALGVMLLWARLARKNSKER
jgi:hypothetical protein